MINFLNELGSSATQSGWLMLLQTALLVGALLLLDLILHRRVRAAIRYALWLLVVFKVLLPPSLLVPTGVGYWLGHWFAPPAPVAAPARMQVSAEEVEPTLIPTGPAATPALPRRPALNPAGRLMLIWVAGSAGLALWMAQRQREIRKLATSAEWAPGELIETAAEAAARLGLRTVPEVRLTQFNHSPAVCGLFRPVVLLPAKLARELGPDALRDVLLHELAHVQRRDLWFNFLQAAVQIVWWWNPFVWFANGRIRTLRELAVDERVMLLQSGESPSYPGTLVEVARHCTARPALALSFVGILESRRALRGRIERLLNVPLPRRAGLGWSGWLTVVSAALLGLPMAFARRVEVAAPSTAASPAPLEWRAWSQEAVSAARKNGSPVLVDFTADWCVSCKATRRAVLESQAVRARLRSLGVVTLVADLTHANPAIEAELKSLGRSGVPALAFYPQDEAEEPALLPEVPTRETILTYLDSVGERPSPTAPGGPAAEFAPLSPELRARYGLDSRTPGAAPSPGTGTTLVMDPALAARYGLTPNASAGSGALDRSSTGGTDPKLAARYGLAGRYGSTAGAAGASAAGSLGDAARPEQLLTRQFRVSPRAFIAGLESVTGTPIGKDPASAPPDGPALNALVRDFFSAAGVEFPAFQVTTNGTASSERKALFFNGRTGVLFVRATEADLATIEQAIQVLNVSPPQVVIETKFVEVDAANANGAGFEWLPGGAPTGTTVSGILTDAQYRAAVTRLDSLGGTETLATPRVTTLSGRQAQIQAVQLQAIVDPVSQTTNDVPFGPTLDVIPHVSADDQNIELTVVASLTKFHGYTPDAPHLPLIESNSLNTHALVRDGQTLVIVGSPAEPTATGSGAAKPKRRLLLVFVTPRIIDPAGNLVNPPK